MHLLRSSLEPLGLDHPLSYLAIFLAASLLVIWRVEALLDRGFEGTALGALVLPYCSGFGNLVFVFLVLRDQLAPTEIVVNSLVNNITNLTLLLGLPALIWGLTVVADSGGTRGGKRRSRRSARANGALVEARLSRLSLLLTLAAVGFFTAALVLLGHDGVLDRGDGLVLVGLFLFWQSIQVFDALKHSVRNRVDFGPAVLLDVVGILVGAALLYESLDWLVQWLTTSRQGFFRPELLGWLSGWLLVLPNALLALYYAARRRADIVYSSQIGDGHVCIPLAVGLGAIWQPIVLPELLLVGCGVIFGAAILHALCLSLLGKLPRILGGGLILAYVIFVVRELNS
ncbi:MAG TPA: sodium:calcium symporter [Candidatus Synoicihabitans sp.]|nr:sodium:calcium symporter [Candidatus Synoicihabitans sp.]